MTINQGLITARYEWTHGAHIQADAQAAARQFEQLHNRDGSLHAESVIEANTPADAPLHSEFEFDDTVAAHHYRIDQATYLIRSIRRVPVRLDTEDELPAERAYIPARDVEMQSVPESDGVVTTAHSYVPVRIASSPDAHMARVRQNAIENLLRMARRYRVLPGCEDIAGALEDMLLRFE